MALRKILFIDRDGTLIREPDDEQVDSLEKLEFVEGVIPALLDLQRVGYRLVMVTNQDGLGTASFPEPDFSRVQSAMMRLFDSQGVRFDEVLVCPHRASDGCVCRKPGLGLVTGYLTGEKPAGGELDRDRSFVIGDRPTDVELARNMGIQSLHFGKQEGAMGWAEIAQALTNAPRVGRATRSTKETRVNVEVRLDDSGAAEVKTGIGFFDHMLEQLARHGGFALKVGVEGDLHIDEHHTVEDTALVIGEALRRALGDKVGIGRYGFVLPMDEAESRVSVDLSGRPYLVFKGTFQREKVGELPTELVPHFYRSFAETLGATLHIEVLGENAHHMVESTFKGVGRALRPALALTGGASVPSTKGAL